MGIALLEALGSLFLTLFFDAISTGIVTQLAADEFLGRKTNLKKVLIQPWMSLFL